MPSDWMSWWMPASFPKQSNCANLTPDYLRAPARAWACLFKIVFLSAIILLPIFWVRTVQACKQPGFAAAWIGLQMQPQTQDTHSRNFMRLSNWYKTHEV